MTPEATTHVVFFLVYYTLLSIIAQKHLEDTFANPVLWYMVFGVGGAVLAASFGYAGVIVLFAIFFLHRTVKW